MVCADGTQCASGKTCAAVDGTTRCIDPGQRDACAGDGQTCTNEGGRCRDSDDGKVCIVATCGDSVVDIPERCDDGNRVSNDGCSAECASTEVCGDAVIDLQRGEQCDDGPPTLSGDGCSPTCQTEFRVWRDVSPESPTRWLFGLARDPLRGVVMHGGASAGMGNLSSTQSPTSIFTETYRWLDGGPHLGPVGSPGPRRMRASVAYDPKTSRVLLYGGITSTNLRTRDLWTWDGVQWSATAPLATDPGPRSDAAFACSPARCLLVGGLTGMNGTFSNATFAWDGQSWSQLQGQPLGFPDRAGATLTYHAGLGQFLLFGGDASAAGGTADTWTMDDGATTWTLRPGSTPPAHTLNTDYPSAAYDEVNQKVVLVVYQGQTYTWAGTWTNTLVTAPFTDATLSWDATRQRVIAIGHQTNGALAEYEWTGSTWFKLDVGLATSSTSQAGAYNELTGELVVVDEVTGGLAWDGTGWARRPGDLRARKQTRLAYDATCGRVLAYGGIGTGNLATGELEELTATSWDTIAPSGPPVRVEPAVAYDRAGERLVMFGGGGNGGPTFDDLWIYSGPCESGGWTPVPRTDPWPPARTKASLTYDRERQRLILFGGLGADDKPLGDTWALSGGTWTQLQPTTSPSARARHGATYDPRRRRVVIVGGRTADGVTNEVWELGDDTWREIATVVSINSREGLVLERDRTGFPMAIGGYSTGLAPVQTLSRLTSELDPSMTERCVMPIDADADGRAGCEDPDCAGRCAPTCAYGEDCAGPRCGDGTCSALEDPVFCPADCP